MNAAARIRLARLIEDSTPGDGQLEIVEVAYNCSTVLGDSKDIYSKFELVLSKPSWGGASYTVGEFHNRADAEFHRFAMRHFT